MTWWTGRRETLKQPLDFFCESFFTFCSAYVNRKLTRGSLTDLAEQIFPWLSFLFRNSPLFLSIPPALFGKHHIRFPVEVSVKTKPVEGCCAPELPPMDRQTDVGLGSYQGGGPGTGQPRHA